MMYLLKKFHNVGAAPIPFAVSECIESLQDAANEDAAVYLDWGAHYDNAAWYGRVDSMSRYTCSIVPIKFIKAEA